MVSRAMSFDERPKVKLLTAKIIWSGVTTVQQMHLVWGNITVTEIVDILACNLLAAGSAINLQEACYECSTACNIGYVCYMNRLP
jgi:hypothetical protein